MLYLADHTDDELVRLLVERDRDAFDSIYNRYWRLLYDTAYRRIRNEDQCKDIVQDIFIDLWLRRGKVDIQNLKAYLLGAVRFQVFKTVAKDHGTPAFYEPFQQMILAGFGADGNVIEKELAALFREWLGTLPEKRREIFILHFAEKLSADEIARRLHISKKTVQNQLSISVSDLRGRLAGFLLFSFV